MQMQRENKYFVGSIIFLVVMFLTILSIGVHGQELTPQPQGYVFFGPGAAVCCSQSSTTMHLGGGGEIFVRRGFAIGGELGYLAPKASFASGFGVLSANPAYHFAGKSESKVVPFVTGGYSLGFRSGRINMANFGGGVTWWVAQRHGIRFEFRDHYAWATDVHYPSFRVAWTFR